MYITDYLNYDFFKIHVSVIKLFPPKLLGTVCKFVPGLVWQKCTGNTVCHSSFWFRRQMGEGLNNYLPCPKEAGLLEKEGGGGGGGRGGGVLIEN